MKAIKYENLKLKELLDWDRDRELVVPNFQREFKWGSEQQRDLLCSLLAGVPMGSLLLLSGEKNDYDSRALCFNKKIDPKESCTYLLDGQQRLSVLKSIVVDFFSEKTYNHFFNTNGDYADCTEITSLIYSKLKRRWFLKIFVKENGIDPFGYKILKFPTASILEPSDYKDFIEERQISQCDETKWFNPQWYIRKSEDKGVESAKNEIAEKAAEEGLVPLWEIYHNPENGLHVKVLSKIAWKRCSEIQAQIKDGNLKLNDVFKDYSEDFETLLNTNPDLDKDKWADLRAQWKNAMLDYLKKILETEIPAIRLPKNDIQRGVFIFETINRGGTPLDVFDLAVARLARLNDVSNLSERLIKIVGEGLIVPEALYGGKRPKQWFATSMKIVDQNTLSHDFKQSFLNYLGIVCARNKRQTTKPDHFKKKWILDLQAEEIRDNYASVAKALVRACCFLQFRCGVVSMNDLKYKLMILPLASAVEKDDVWASKEKLDKIEYWYWVSLFGGAYMYRQNETCAMDITNLLKWIVDHEENPFINRRESVLKVKEYSDEAAILKLSERHSQTAVELAFLQYILSRGPKDLLDENNVLHPWLIASGEIQIEDHHIIPLGSAKNIQESSKEIRKDKKSILNSVANRTYLLGESNKKISSVTYEKYFEYIKKSSLEDHILPSMVEDIKKKANEDEKEYHRRVISRRFHDFQSKLESELQNLLS